MGSRMVGLVLLIFGALMLASEFQQSAHWGIARLADIVRLTGIGACFGVAFVSLIGRLKVPGR